MRIETIWGMLLKQRLTGKTEKPSEVSQARWEAMQKQAERELDARLSFPERK